MTTATLSESARLVAGCSHTEAAESQRGRISHPRSLVSRLARQAVLRHLTTLQGGRIHIDDGQLLTVGRSADDELSSTIVVRSDRFYRRLLAGGALGLAESYLDGEWHSDDLTALLRIFCRNLNQLASATRGLTSLLSIGSRIAHRLARNTRSGSRRNIHAHYDLGNEFFGLFLDPSLMYSSAIFEEPQVSLEQAQLARLERICRKLELQPSDHLVEIGTGWGGFAHYAARNYGCRVTTTTISRNQYEFAARRIADAGLSDRVKVLNQDYRELQGRFDKLVSIEMVEAVGHEFYDQYFRKCAGLLKPDSRMLLQAIVMPEQRHAAYLKSVDFIQKYIFPGGCLPSITAMQKSVTGTSNLRLLSLNDFAADYAQTLREWRRRFHAHLDDVRAQGFPERFIRLWDYYLCYCEAAFEEQAVGVVHAVWGR